MDVQMSRSHGCEGATVHVGSIAESMLLMVLTNGNTSHFIMLHTPNELDGLFLQ